MICQLRQNVIHVTVNFLKKFNHSVNFSKCSNLPTKLPGAVHCESDQLWFPMWQLYIYCRCENSQRGDSC